MAHENDEIIESFVTEASEGLADMENDLLAMESETADSLDEDLVNKVFRNIHSIKGTAGFCGLTAINNLAHETENVLNLVRGGELIPRRAIVEVLLKSADMLSGMVADIGNSNDVDVAPQVAALKMSINAEAPPEVKQEMNRDVDIALSNGTLAFLMISEFELATRQRQGMHVYVLDVDFFEDVQNRDRTPIEFMNELYRHGEVVSSYVSTAGVGTLSEPAPDTLSFLVLYCTSEDEDHVCGTLALSEERIHHIANPDETEWSADGPTRPAVAEAPAPVIAPMETSSAPAAPVAAPAADAPAAPKKAAAPPANLRVSVAVLDRLMNLAGELVLGRNQLMQVIDHGEKQGLELAGARIDRITSELQEAIMQTRMQPVGTVLNKFPRIVRDLSSSLGKQCELAIEGKGVELDKSIIEAIGDPLTHLIRNSVDHGVEMPDIRAAAGKPVTGTVVLKAYHEAGKVNITITDDGAGINAEKLRAKAVEKGILSDEEAKDMPDREAVRLIFHPGFSLAAAVTDVSGRGVGMDVVRTNIEKLGGIIDIETKVGVGTTMSIQLPLTMAIIPCLVVCHGGDRFAVPQTNIRELIRIKSSEVKTRLQRVQGAEVLRIRGELLPLIRLSGALGTDATYTDSITGRQHENRRQNIADRRTPDDDARYQEQRSNEDRRSDTVAGAMNIIVLESGELRYGMVVEALEDSQEIVVKPLGRHMAECGCFAGATILGDGKVALILDVAGVAAECSLRAVHEDAPDDVVDSIMADGSQSVLMFRNHPDEMFAIPTALVSRIERIQATQIDSVGGLDVLQYRGTSMPLISLDTCIKAKPRNECERLHVLVVNVAGKDIGLIAPVLCDINNEASTDIDTVTFAEPGVLGSLIIDDVAIRFVDVVSIARNTHPEWFATPQGTTDGNEQVRLLLAEDSGFFRTQVTTFLESEGYHVTACEDGQEAWETFQRDPGAFRLIVTDIEMPNLDGLGFVRKIRAGGHSELPIIALTSLAADADVQRGIEAGINEYQVKMDRDNLLSAIGKLLKEHGIVPFPANYREAA